MGNIVDDVVKRGQALYNGVTNAFTGFAYGGQPGAKVQGSPENRIYTDANQNYANNMSTAFGSQGTYDSNAVQAPQVLPQQQAPQVDPNAAIRAAALADFNSGRQSYLDSVNSRIGNEATQYGRGVEDYFTSAQAKQTALNQKAAQNELAKVQGRADILSKVSRGTKSAGVMLGQKNASNSSAAQAIANAYGEIGNRDAQKVEQGYALNNEGINLEQQNFNDANQRTIKRTEEDKNNIINSIIDSATQEISRLNSQAANASLPNRLAIDAEKNRIRNEATAKLQQYDGQLNQARGLTGYSQDQRLAEAQRLASLGTAAAQPFQIAPEVDFQAQSQYDPSSGLPLFSLAKRRLA